jgi:hypothetical protein
MLTAQQISKMRCCGSIVTDSEWLILNFSLSNEAGLEMNPPNVAQRQEHMSQSHRDNGRRTTLSVLGDEQDAISRTSEKILTT